MTAIPPIRPNGQTFQTACNFAKKTYCRFVIAGTAGGACLGARFWDKKLVKETEGPPLNLAEYLYGGYVSSLLGASTGLFASAAFPVTAVWLSNPKNRSSLKDTFF